jgi:hypothetical protein
MKTYNGYTNYETWCYMHNLQTDSDISSTYEREINSMTVKEFAIHLENEFEEEITERELPNVFVELLLAASSEINFDEIAELIFTDYKK